MKKSHWLVKQEPETYPWSQFVSEGGAAWTGVRNFQARNHLRAMCVGDSVLFYHSGTGKCVVGEASVRRAAYDDPTAEEGDWSCVDLVPVRPLPRPVPLAEIKTNPVLARVALIRQSRLSVMPLGSEEYAEIVRMAKR
jgi:predicted RNA-binding protein with PUA-like domain